VHVYQSLTNVRETRRGNQE